MGARVYTFNAATLGRAWLAVRQASAKDPDLPALDRTICIEAYDAGIRLSATDRYILLTAWVPDLGQMFDREPTLDEAPEATAIAIDTGGRVTGLLAYGLQLANAAEKGGWDDDVAVHVTLDAAEPEGEEGVFNGMGRKVVTFELADKEMVYAQRYEGDYPNWRFPMAGFKAKSTVGIAINPAYMGRLAKIGKVYPGCLVVTKFGGENKMLAVTVRHEDHTVVEGGLMPVRLNADLTKPEPIKEKTKPDPEDGESDNVTPIRGQETTD